MSNKDILSFFPESSSALNYKGKRTNSSLINEVFFPPFNPFIRKGAIDKKKCERDFMFHVCNKVLQYIDFDTDF